MYRGRRFLDGQPGMKQSPDEDEYAKIASRIPPRASARTKNGDTARRIKAQDSAPSSRDDITRIPTWPSDADVTRVPTIPQTSRSHVSRHESPSFEAESSLSSLTLIESETQPQLRSPSIDELHTLPPRKLWPSEPGNTVRQQYPHNTPNPVDQVSPALLGETAITRAVDRSPQDEHTLNSFHRWRGAGMGRRRGTMAPLEGVRWWLLYPGRIEFLLWVAGALVLIAFTILLLPLTFLSFFGFHEGQGSSPHSPLPRAASSPATTSCGTGNGGQTDCAPMQVITPAGLRVLLLNDNGAKAGVPLRFEGSGFTPSGRIDFSYDAKLPCRPASMQADTRGYFSAILAPGDAVGWSAGGHRLMVEDLATGRSVSLPFSLLPGDTQ